MRHKDIEKQLSEELKAEVFDQVAISETIFENGNFKELASIKNWERDLAGTKIGGAWIRRIRRVCVGNMKIQGGRLDIEGWGLKHPDRLNLDDAKEFIYQLKKAKLRTREWRLALRSFMASKGIVVKSTDISGELEEDAGKFAHLFVAKVKLDEIFAWLKDMNKDAYLASKFAFTTGARLTATLEADAQYLNKAEMTILVFEKSKRRKKKRRIIKRIRQDLWDELDLDHKKGKLFNIAKDELNALLRSAYKEIIPELEPQIVMPFHFWRHMFAQHALRKSGWNTQIVASLGGWSTEALEKYYGKPDKAVVDAFAQKLLPEI
jgi:integrase